MSQPLVSVIMPVYNREAYVEDAIYSILEQSLQDFELIVWDDNSTDKSQSIITKIEDKRIRFYQNSEHEGVSISRNKAFKKANGKYIAFMDSDDIAHPERLYKQVEFLENNLDVKACGCWLKCFGDQQYTIKHKGKPERIQAELLLHNPMSLGATTVVRDYFKEFQFDPLKLHVEDYDYWAKTAWNCRMTNLQEVLYFYRSHKKQVSVKFLQIQREQDVAIKIDLFKKIAEDYVTLNESLLIRVMFSEKPLKLNEYKTYIQFLRILRSNNRNKKVFDQFELKKVLERMLDKIVYELFFVNKRNANLNLRANVFIILPARQQIKIITRKLKKKLFLKRI